MEWAKWFYETLEAGPQQATQAPESPAAPPPEPEPAGTPKPRAAPVCEAHGTYYSAQSGKTQKWFHQHRVGVVCVEGIGLVDAKTGKPLPDEPAETTDRDSTLGAYTASGEFMPEAQGGPAGLPQEPTLPGTPPPPQQER